MKIYTKTGDKGFTGLIGGTRVTKAHIRIESYGTVDELNAYLGLITDQDIASEHKQFIKTIQDTLFTVGASLAADPDKPHRMLPDLTDSDVLMLEEKMDEMEKQLPPLKHFILPGGNNAISFCHVARCICRRAERIVVKLSEESLVDELVIVYLNRLSDYLFVLARKIGSEHEIAENKWLPKT
ncbi:cob(I)yrinic acid a,c-diamide adenosyltransferase [Mucilaginibacter aquatilis]|uniref:Corrinoid adenosyltransferase n=1 Tax=Mucilaginibacter aquatilis TaxID=1517760 RepID=A0A6I4I378_9SPHI|nr:cob(I)yrinic acid a,c-diamide adenosyltransferase [Mucilaginibacter aquatilis]MVN89582.1 cob(I)yrinic acid a,c-diamide adenosyltransferase [Mucilaginibacter aquatilis]